MSSGTAIALAGLGLVLVYLWTRAQPTVSAPQQPPCGVPISYGGVTTVIPCSAVKDTVNAVVNTGTAVGSYLPNALNHAIAHTGALPVTDQGHIDAPTLISRAMCDFYNEGKVFGGNPLVVDTSNKGALRGSGLVAAIMPGNVCMKGNCDCNPQVIPGDASGAWGTVKYMHDNKPYTTPYDFRPLKITGFRNYTGGGTTINLGNVF